MNKIRKRKSPIAKTLVKNGCAAMLAAVEIHNKPVFDYRYEVCTLLAINAWELVLKALIYRAWKDVPLEDAGQPLAFKKCLNIIESRLAGDSRKKFLPVKESVEQLYTYRNKVAHFHSEALDAVLFSLLRANVSLFVEFSKEYFPKDFRMETSILLPINLSGNFNPVEFLVKQPVDSNASLEVRDFINGLFESCRRLQAAGIEDSIFSVWSVELISAKKASNADILAARANDRSDATPIEITNRLGEIRISNSPSAQEVRLSDEEFFKIYTESYDKVAQESRKIFSDFKQNHDFYNLMKAIESNRALCGVRSLDPEGKGVKRKLYSSGIYDELAKHYTRRSPTRTAPKEG